VCGTYAEDNKVAKPLKMSAGASRTRKEFQEKSAELSPLKRRKHHEKSMQYI
jgi:hypothetical protein